MIKTLASANALEREKFRIPRSVQHSIPIKKIYRDGLWHSGNKHSCTWRFSDINYVSASDEDKRSIFMLYSSVINSLPTDAGVKISIVNHRLNPADFQRTMLMPYRDDGLDYLRAESNRINTDRAAASNNLVQEKYITLSIGEKRIEDSRAYFRRVDGNLRKSMGRLGADTQLLNSHDRLRILHDFFRPGAEQYFNFEHKSAVRLGADFKDFVCPDSMVFKADHFIMGGKYARVLFLRDYASYIKDNMISELSDFSRNMVISIDILPIPTDEAVKEVQSRILGTIIRRYS